MTPTPITPRTGLRIRRRVFLITGGTVVASMLACGGLVTTLAQPQAVDFGQSQCGGATMTTPNPQPTTPAGHVLVTYASRAGSTAEVAQAVAAQLCTHGYTVDVRPIDQVDDVTPYQRVVVGSAIRMGQWLPAAVKFVEAHKTELSAKPTAFFTVHLQNTGDDDAARQARAAYIAPVHTHLTPTQEAFFAGTMNFAKLSWIDKLIAKLVGSQEVDLRDWQAIRTWADQVALS